MVPLTNSATTQREYRFYNVTATGPRGGLSSARLWLRVDQLQTAENDDAEARANILLNIANALRSDPSLVVQHDSGVTIDDLTAWQRVVITRLRRPPAINTV